MLPFRNVAVFALLAVTFAQDFDDYDSPRPAPARVRPGYSGPSAPRPTPIAILKQINRHNEDGSYTYGYESADGSFKIETKLPNGEVKGKYGYVDDTGKVRVVEYGATKYGFAPSGEGITVPAPTLVDETTDKNGNTLPQYSADDYYDNSQEAPAPVSAYRQPPAPVSQYRPAPAISKPRPQPQTSFEAFDFGPQQFGAAPQRSSAPVPPRANIPGAAPVHTQTFDFGPSPSPVKSYAPSPSRSFEPARSFAPAPRPAPAYNPAPIEEDFGEPESAPIRSSPRITYAQPANRPQPEPQYAPIPRPAPRPVLPSGRSGGILDQLSKDYALPQGGAAPLHDISFGYY